MKRGMKRGTETYGDQSTPSTPHVVQGSGPEALSNQPGPPTLNACCLCSKGHIPLQTTGPGPFLNWTWHWIWTLPVPELLKENVTHLFTGKKWSYQEGCRINFRDSQAMAYMKKEDYQAADRPKSQLQQKNIPLKELVCISCQSSCLTVFILPPCAR